MRSDSDVTADAVEPAEEPPLEPVYPFNEPGQQIRLHEGRLAASAGGDVNGVIWMSCGSQFDVRWKVDDDVPSSWMFDVLGTDAVTFALSRPGGNVEVTGRLRTTCDGTFDGSTLGSADSLLSQVVVHWMNLPDVHGKQGRLRFSIGEWELVLVPRPDHKQVWEALGFDPCIAMTHVMSIARRDGKPFAAHTVQAVLRALHFGTSFAFGRWIPPALPVGFSDSGVAVWEQWGSLFCDPGRNGSLAWLYRERADDLQKLLARALEAFSDPQRDDIARHLLSRAIEANHSGRVERRIMTAFPALEWLCWEELKVSGKMSGNSYNRMSTAARLERLLADARVPIDVDASTQPALSAFASTKSETGTPASGPQVVTWVRHQLVHAKSPYEDVYEIKGLLTEAWLLTRHYLALLLLKWLRYDGLYQAILGPNGTAGDDEPVPWSVRANPGA